MAVHAAGNTDREAFAAEPETTGKVRVASPQTGADYLASLADDREVYIYGERVADVTRHPAFRNTARMVARLYDALHDPAKKDILTTPTDTGNGGYTHKFFKHASSVDDLVGQQAAITEWAALTIEMMIGMAMRRAAVGPNVAFTASAATRCDAPSPEGPSAAR